MWGGGEYRRPTQISTYACWDNRRDYALKIEMRVLLTSKKGHAPKVMTLSH